MQPYALLRVERRPTFAKIAATGRHNERLRDTAHVDPTKTHLNERLAGTDDWLADAKERLAAVPKIRKNACRGIEVFMGASSPYFDGATQEERDRRRNAWRDASMQWLADTFGGRENIVSAVLHRDEAGSPHIHALVVPIDHEGKLSSTRFIGGDKNRMCEHQTSYARAVEHLGLQRGREGSTATHQETKYWRDAMQRTPEQIKHEIEHAVHVEPPPRIVGSPDDYARRQQQQILGAIMPHIEALGRQVQYLQEQVERLEQRMQAQTARREEERRRFSDLRDIPVTEVLERFGANRDQQREGRWHLQDEGISVNGQSFFNHTRQQGGRGAIDLTMQTFPLDFKQTVAFLRAAFQGDRAAVAGDDILKAFNKSKQHIDFRAPEPDALRWPQVRAALVEDRCLAPEHVDALHRGGILYADSQANAVFLRRNHAGGATGAYAARTNPGQNVGGLAPGSYLAPGCAFRFAVPGTIDPKGEAGQPTLIVADTPIEALSLLELHRRAGPKHGPIEVMSLDGTDQYHWWPMLTTLQRGGSVHIATSSDRVGESIAQRIRKDFPEGPIHRVRPQRASWNEMLREQVSPQRWEPQERPLERPQEPEPERDAGPGWGRMVRAHIKAQRNQARAHRQQHRREQERMHEQGQQRERDRGDDR